MDPTDEQLRMAVEESSLIQRKIPDAEKRKQFLVRLLKEPGHKKTLFFISLKKAESDLEAAAATELNHLQEATNNITALLQEAKRIYRNIETEEHGQAEDILKNI